MESMPRPQAAWRARYGFARSQLRPRTPNQPSVRLVRIDIEGHVDWRQQDVAPRQARLFEADELRHLALVPGALQLSAFALQSCFRRRFVGDHWHVLQRVGLFRYAL